MTGPVNVLCVLLPLRIVSVLNEREHHMVRARRSRLHRTTARMLLRQAHRARPVLPVTVTLTRIAPRKLDGDNNQAGLKACRDGVADWLEVNDNHPDVTWKYGQRTGKPKEYAAEVVVEWAA